MKSPRQAVAIGLSKARRAGVAVKPPAAGASAGTRTKARRDTEKGKGAQARKQSAAAKPKAAAKHKTAAKPKTSAKKTGR